ncbi:MAG: hypothetical protein R3C58_14430 [Parvularculaceae bacterium]
MNFLEQMRDLRERAKAHPRLLNLLDELEALEKTLSEEEQKPLLLPYATQPKRSANVWKTTY